VKSPIQTDARSLLAVVFCCVAVASFAQDPVPEFKNGLKPKLAIELLTPKPVIGGKVKFRINNLRNQAEEGVFIGLYALEPLGGGSKDMDWGAVYDHILFKSFILKPNEKKVTIWDPEQFLDHYMTLPGVQYKVWVGTLSIQNEVPTSFTRSFQFSSQPLSRVTPKKAPKLKPKPKPVQRVRASS
jgi:hypothetical protein